MRKTYFLLVALVVLCPGSSWAEKKVIAPPEFSQPGALTLPFSPGILIDGTLVYLGPSWPRSQDRDYCRGL